MNLTVVTHALNVAPSRRPAVQLIVLGGIYQASSASFSATDSLRMLERLRISKAPISAGGADEKRGVSCSNFHEVPIKQQAIENAVASYLVVDASKFGKVKPAWRAETDAFDGIA